MRRGVLLPGVYNGGLKRIGSGATLLPSWQQPLLFLRTPTFLISPPRDGWS
jgi:hypothetical protein